MRGGVERCGVDLAGPVVPGSQLVDPGRVDIEADRIVEVPGELGGHRQAHIAQADHSDPFDIRHPHLCTALRWPRLWDTSAFVSHFGEPVCPRHGDTGHRRQPRRPATGVVR